MKRKISKYLLHVAAWVLFFIPIVIFVFRTNSGTWMLQNLLSVQFLAFSFTYLFLFYVNTYILFPALYLKKKYAYYFFTIILMFVAVYYLRPFDALTRLNAISPPPHGEEIIQPLHKPQIDIISIVLFIMVWAVSFAFCFIRQWQFALQKAARAEAEKTNAELSYLKAQINPHFLFNTLNSIYSLAIQKSDKTPQAVVKLSELMRYVIKDANNTFVSLDKEINYITNYIDLQSTRLGDTTLIRYNFQGTTNGKQIAPLILISFIENAFKYGVNPDESSEIKIDISVTQNELRMFVFNKKVKVFIDNSEDGIGEQNAITRLQLLYGDEHTLKIDDEKESYSVTLTITLK